MKLRPLAFGVAAGVLWGFGLFIVGVVNLSFPPYGEALLRMASSIYPGYDYGIGGLGEVVIGALYALLDGFVGGLVFAWLYNLLAREA